jgi:glycosidase
LIQNAEWWIETAGLDGLRLDTFPYVDRQFWHDFHAQLHSLYPHLTTVGEVWDEDPTIVSYFAGGAAHADGPENQPVDTGLDTPFDFPTYFALRAVIVHGEPMTRLVKTLRQDSLYPHSERLVPFEGNHDTKRFLSEPGATHAELKLAFGLLATLRGMPEIYSGDEIAMEGSDDPDNRRDFPGGFTGDLHDAFTAAGRMPEQTAMHDYVASLFRFRQAHSALTGGAQQEIFVSDTAFAFARTAGPEHLLVVVNNADYPQSLKLNLQQTVLAGAVHLDGAWNTAAHWNVAQGTVQVEVPPPSVGVYNVEGAKGKGH